jgi:hypothetical protein
MVNFYRTKAIYWIYRWCGECNNDKLDDILKVNRYKDGILSGWLAGICCDPYDNKEIVMKGDTYIFYGNLYLTGDINKGSFNAASGAWKIKWLFCT